MVAQQELRPPDTCHMMTVHVLIFSSLAQLVGERELDLSLPDRATVGDALDHLSARHPPIQAARQKIAAAVNMTYVNAEHALSDGDKLALIPPISGG